MATMVKSMALEGIEGFPVCDRVVLESKLPLRYCFFLKYNYINVTHILFEGGSHGRGDSFIL